MNRWTRSLMTLGVVVLLVLFGGMLTGQQRVMAEPFSFDFTYTSSDTTKYGRVGVITQFHSRLENTGDQSDDYLLTIIENPPTPPEWWRELCAGGICWDSLDDTARVALAPGEYDDVRLDVLPRTVAQGSYTITVQSYGNPGLVKSKTFLLTSYETGPVTDRWGLIILIMLVLASGSYLLYRRYRLVR